MHTAKGLFEKNGIDSVTFAQIAEGADMCRSTVFNHFSNVTELMLAIISQEIEDIRDYCREKSYTGKDLIYSVFEKEDQIPIRYSVFFSITIIIKLMLC